MQISKEALQDNDTPDDSLTEEDLKVCVSPVSPAFHTIETVRLSLHSKGTNTSSPEIKMYYSTLVTFPQCNLPR